VKFNLNEHVRVKLTAHGRQILRSQHEVWLKSIPKLGDFVLPKEDEDGWSEWQMWHLMETFGNHIHLGHDIPFDLDIEIVTDKANGQS
jgi:hypothetical protein